MDARTRWATLVPAIMDPAERILHLAEGAPCEHPWRVHDYSELLGLARGENGGLRPARKLSGWLVPAASDTELRTEIIGGSLLAPKPSPSTELVRYAATAWRTSQKPHTISAELPVSRPAAQGRVTAEYAAGLNHCAKLRCLTPGCRRSFESSDCRGALHQPTYRVYAGGNCAWKHWASSRTAAGVLAVQNGWLRMPMPVHVDVLASLDIAELVRTSSAGLQAETAQQAITERKSPHPVRLGLAYPAGGPAQSDGAQSRRGAMLAVDEINERGGIRGHLIEAVHVDSDIYTADGVHRTFAELRGCEAHAVLMSYVFDEAAAIWRSCCNSWGYPCCIR
ncbi:hypothetical protein FQR65_LT20503 [Abscondita terminalis]|nr:hypothetical protein FQR65_LT20503 [Abscondita terminalis]